MRAIERFWAFKMKVLLVVVSVCLSASGVFGISAHTSLGESSSPFKLDLAGIKEALLSSAAGLEPFTAAHLSRTRREAEAHDHPSCCGDYNKAILKEETQLANDCFQTIKHHKYHKDSRKGMVQMYLCLHECMCKKEGMCDDKGNLKPKAAQKYCTEYYEQKELNDMLAKQSNTFISQANSQQQAVAKHFEMDFCNAAAGIFDHMIDDHVVKNCPQKHVKKSKECDAQRNG
ncbi:uncharacterized protein [Periplaneta americana]|uniref:uncharacterized protein n=1 Tax=Periplaneta americana TaxID=6978 RepID=UPI0037E93ADC